MSLLGHILRAIRALPDLADLAHQVRQLEERHGRLAQRVTAMERDGDRRRETAA